MGCICPQLFPKLFVTTLLLRTEGRCDGLPSTRDRWKAFVSPGWGQRRRWPCPSFLPSSCVLSFLFLPPSLFLSSLPPFFLPLHAVRTTTLQPGHSAMSLQSGLLGAVAGTGSVPWLGHSLSTTSNGARVTSLLSQCAAGKRVGSSKGWSLARVVMSPRLGKRKGRWQTLLGLGQSRPSSGLLALVFPLYVHSQPVRSPTVRASWEQS